MFVIDIKTMSATGPTIKRGRSAQDISTPWEFIHAVERRFGKLICDLAATADNAKCEQFITPEQDTFSVNWWELSSGPLWLNPEFDPIQPFLRKCAYERRLGAEVLVLSPASVGSNWFWDYIQPNATVYCLHPRLQFEGQDNVYPKDLILSHFTHTVTRELKRWNWKVDIVT